jgi:hypothetical protein
LFYLAYVAGLVFLVSVPALRDAAPGRAALHGAIIGAMAYGTYEFTSMSIMKDWSWQMVATDTIWGAVLTGFSAWAGVVLLLRFHAWFSDDSARACGHSGFPFGMISNSNFQNGGLNEQAAVCGVGHLVAAAWPHLPGKVSDAGAAEKDNRLFLEAVFWRGRTGSLWRDLPPAFRHWNSQFRRFRR